MKYEQREEEWVLTPQNEQELQILCALVSKWAPAAWPPAECPSGGWPKNAQPAPPEGDEWKGTP